MSKAPTLLIIFLITLIANHDIVFGEPPTKPTFATLRCMTKQGSFALNSTYENNLKIVLLNLQQHASTTMFYNTSVGTDNNTVHGQYYCRGDVSREFCNECIQAATNKALKSCSLGVPTKAGVVWYKECTLRYSNESMYGIESDADDNSPYWTGDDSDEPEKFSSVLDTTITTLVSEAVHGNDTRRFAFGQSADSTVYCLVQCSPDLNATKCEKCLLTAYDDMKGCCGKWPSEVIVYSTSCVTMYNRNGIFYFDPNAPPTSPPSSQPPPPAISVFQPPPPLPRTSGSGVVGKKLWIITAGVLMVLMVIDI